MTKVPTFDQMMNPLIQALKNLGGSGTIEEMYVKVSEELQLSDEQLEILRGIDTDVINWVFDEYGFEYTKVD